MTIDQAEDDCDWLVLFVETFGDLRQVAVVELSFGVGVAVLAGVETDAAADVGIGALGGVASVIFEL